MRGRFIELDVLAYHGQRRCHPLRRLSYARWGLRRVRPRDLPGMRCLLPALCADNVWDSQPGIFRVSQELQNGPGNVGRTW